MRFYQKYFLNFIRNTLPICEVSVYKKRTHSVLISEKGECKGRRALSLCLQSLASSFTWYRSSILVVICQDSHDLWQLQSPESSCHCSLEGGRRPGGEPTSTSRLCPKGQEWVSASQCKVRREQKNQLTFAAGERWRGQGEE